MTWGGLGARVVSRLYEACGIVGIPDSVTDYRREMGGQR